MSDERYQPRVRNAGTKNSIQIGYDTEKLKQENRYRVKGQAFPKTFDGFNWGAAVSYTHLTLPTIDDV